MSGKKDKGADQAVHDGSDGSGLETFDESQFHKRKGQEVRVVQKSALETLREKHKEDSFTMKLASILMTVPSEPEFFPVPRANYLDTPPSSMIRNILNDATEIFQRMLKGDAEKVQRSRDLLQTLMRSIGGYYKVSYDLTAEILLEDYEYFDPATSEDKIQKTRITKDMLVQKEDQFIDRLKVVFDKGNFGMLNQREVDEAKTQDYKVTLDIELAEEQYDTTLLNRFFKRYGKALVQRADLTDYMLIFHRGVGVDRDTQLFVTEKLELILDRIKTVVKEQILDRIYKPTRKSDEELKKEIKAAKAAADPKTGGMVLAAFVVLVGVVHETLSRMEMSFTFVALAMLIELGIFFAVVAKYFIPAKGTSAKDLERQRILLHRAELRAQNPLPDLDPDEVFAKIERIRLSQLGLLPHDLVQPHTIQEPTFKQVVCVYRTKGTRFIELKQYSDVPRADIEVLFPYKNIALNSMDFVVFAGSLIAGFVAVFSGLTTDKSDGGADGDMFWVIGFGMAGLAARSVMSLMNTKYYYDSLMTHILYKCISSSNKSLLIDLVAQCADQEMNEAILGYYMLIKYGPMQEEQVDKAAEMFMQKKFDVDVDFEVSDSLGKLVDLGLVEKKDDGTYKCVPLDKALDTMKSQWSTLGIGLDTSGSTLGKAVSKVNPFKLFSK